MNRSYYVSETKVLLCKVHFSLMQYFIRLMTKAATQFIIMALNLPELMCFLSSAFVFTIAEQFVQSCSVLNYTWKRTSILVTLGQRLKIFQPTLAINPQWVNNIMKYCIRCNIFNWTKRTLYSYNSKTNRTSTNRLRENGSGSRVMREVMLFSNFNQICIHS